MRVILKIFPISQEVTFRGNKFSSSDWLSCWQSIGVTRCVKLWKITPGSFGIKKSQIIPFRKGNFMNVLGKMFENFGKIVGLNGPTRIYIQIPKFLDNLDLKNHNSLIWNDPGVNKASFKDNSTCFDRKISKYSWKIIYDFKVIFQFAIVVLPAEDKAKHGISLIFYVYGSKLESLMFEHLWLKGKSGMSITNSFAQPQSSLGQWNSSLIIPLKVLTQI